MKDKGMNPAALAAALEGDLANAAAALTPGGIEAQEARGQRDFVANETLPIKGCSRGRSREQFEQMGIVFGDPVDDLFIKVQLPEGWKKAPTNRSMWSDLIDDKGRKRAGIFYKAAFYDRSAHIGLNRRYSLSVDPVCGWLADNYKQHEWHCVVTDCGESVWQSEMRVEPEPEYQHGNEEQRLAWLDWNERKEALRNHGLAWLDEHYPDWQDPLAYWD